MPAGLSADVTAQGQLWSHPEPPSRGKSVPGALVRPQGGHGGIWQFGWGWLSGAVGGLVQHGKGVG